MIININNNGEDFLQHHSWLTDMFWHDSHLSVFASLRVFAQPWASDYIIIILSNKHRDHSLCLQLLSSCNIFLVICSQDGHHQVVVSGAFFKDFVIAISQRL